MKSTHYIFYSPLPCIDVPPVVDLSTYHPLGTIEAHGLEDAFDALQAENMTPEMRSRFQRLAPPHWSMSVGDLLIDFDGPWVCAPMGWRKAELSETRDAIEAARVRCERVIALSSKPLQMEIPE